MKRISQVVSVLCPAFLGSNPAAASYTFLFLTASYRVMDSVVCNDNTLSGDWPVHWKKPRVTMIWILKCLTPIQAVK